MEKLQIALNNARQSRLDKLGGGTVARGPQSALPTRTVTLDRAANSAQARIAARWSVLTPYEPNPDHLQRNRILTLDGGPISNPFDVLRTKVFLLMQQNGWKRLAITSPNVSCGKTTTACNLAVGMSRQRENRTMLFDMDMRRPDIASVLGRRPPHNIKSMLTGEVGPEDQLLCLRGNVALSLNNVAVPDSTQLLMATQTTDRLDLIQRDFDPDLMIFDLPPMFATDDARAFLRNVDCAMIVARAEYTKTSQLDQCEREVAEQTNVLGIVLNDCRHIPEAEDYSDAY